MPISKEELVNHLETFEKLAFVIVFVNIFRIKDAMFWHNERDNCMRGQTYAT
jgi:hypothetical protein